MVSCRRHECTEVCAAFFRLSFSFFLAIRIHNDECVVNTHTKDNEETVQVKQAHISLLEDKGVEQDCWAEGKHDHCNYTYTEENRSSGEGYVGQHEQDGRRDPHCVSWDVVSNVLLQEWASILHTICVKGHPYVARLIRHARHARQRKKTCLCIPGTLFESVNLDHTTSPPATKVSKFFRVQAWTASDCKHY